MKLSMFETCVSGRPVAVSVVVLIAFAEWLSVPCLGESHTGEAHPEKKPHDSRIVTMEERLTAMEAQLRAIRTGVHKQHDPEVVAREVQHVAQAQTPERQNDVPRESAAAPSEPVGEEQESSQSVEEAFPGTKIPSRPKDYLPRSGAQPMDVPRSLLEPDDPKKVAVLQRRSLMSRFNPAMGVVIDAVGGYNQRTNRLLGLDQDAGRPVGSRWPAGYYANIRDVEVFAAADIDTFARAYAVITAHPENLTRGSVEYGSATPHIEEAAIQTTSLPYNLSIRAGRFFADFGYLARRHSHDMPFIDRPGSIAQVFAEAQVDGAEVTWLAPTPFFLKFTGVYGSRFGEFVHDPLSFHNQQPVQGNVFLGKVTSYYDLTNDHNVELGFSIAHSTNSRAVPGSFLHPASLPAAGETDDNDDAGVTGPPIRRQIMDLDFHYRWYPLGRGQRQSLSLHGEVLYDTGQGRRDVFGHLAQQSSWGGYAYVEYRLNKQWRPGFRFDYHQMLSEPGLHLNPFSGLVGSTPNITGQRTDVRTYSPYLTYYLSEMNRLRLQYNRVSWGNATDTNMLLFQWTVVLGSHVHGFTERD